MIDKNFYLENLTAFDLLIGDDRSEAEKVIYKIYCILQRDKIWISNVALPEEISEEDTELLEDIENELDMLDQTYGFRFAEFHELVVESMEEQTGLLTGEEVDEDDEFEDFYDDLLDDEEEEDSV